MEKRIKRVAFGGSGGATLATGRLGRRHGLEDGTKQAMRVAVVNRPRLLLASGLAVTRLRAEFPRDVRTVAV